MSSGEILVGLDESPAAAGALRWAVGEARRTGQPVRVVHVLGWPFGAHSAGAEDTLTHEQLDARYRASIVAAFDAVGAGPGAVLELVRGDAGPVLVRESSSASALVIGMPQHVGLGRALVGSVAHHCLTHARCPVVAVPRPTSGVTLPGPAQAERPRVIA